MGASANKSGRVAREERERMLLLKRKYESRITVVKFGKESLNAGDYASALKRFLEYLNILAEVKKTKDHYGLRINHFDPQRELTELLMISHIYFELSRLYDAVPKWHDDCKKCLEQFVHFSANQPYQVVNAEMLRKYLRKNIFKNPTDFRNAHQQIFVQSKKCYVVTFCFGETHAVTYQYRELKDILLEYSWGQKLVRHYYRFSSVYVPQWQDSRLAALSGKYVLRPALLVFSKTLLRLILKKC